VKTNESDHKDDRLKEFIKLLSEFDIVCTQEMFGLLNKRKHKLIRCATKAGFHYFADSPSPSFFTTFVVDGGLLVLSRFPIVASEFKPFPYGIFSDSLAQKGVLYTKIQIKEGILHLYSSHTQASYFGETQKYPIMVRADQFTTVRTFMESSLKKNGYKPGDLVLLVGDFNVDARKPFIETEKIKLYPGFEKYPHLGAQEMFNEYEAMTCFISDNNKDELDDLLLQNHGEHPITYAESKINETDEPVPLETVLTHKDDHCSNQSLDFIFRLNPRSIFNTSSQRDLEEGDNYLRQNKLRVAKKSAKIQKFFISGHTFTQLSDHYGATVTLEYGTSYVQDSEEESKRQDTGKIGINDSQIAETSHDQLLKL